MKQISRLRALLALPLFGPLQIAAGASSPAWCQSSLGFLTQGPVAHSTATSGGGTFAAAGATVFWEQLANSTLPSNVDPDFPEFSSYQVSDVIFTNDSTITSVCIWVAGNRGSAWLTKVNSARLNIVTKNPLLDTDDPSAGDIVEATVTEGAGLLKIEATGLRIAANAGQNRIGITPINVSDVADQGFHQSSNLLIGSEGLFRNPGGGFAPPFGRDWESVSAAVGFGTQVGFIGVFDEISDTCVGMVLCSWANTKQHRSGCHADNWFNLPFAFVLAGFLVHIGTCSLAGDGS